MFDNLSRHTLIRLTDGGVFLIKCKVMELHSGEEIPCYLGQRYTTEVDYFTTRCYTNQIDSIIKEL
jgi:hypothetical protein